MLQIVKTVLHIFIHCSHSPVLQIFLYIPHMGHKDQDGENNRYKSIFIFKGGGRAVMFLH